MTTATKGESRTFGKWKVGAKGIDLIGATYSIPADSLWDINKRWQRKGVYVHDWVIHVMGRCVENWLRYGCLRDFLAAYEYALIKFSDKIPEGTPFIDFSVSAMIAHKFSTLGVDPIESKGFVKSMRKRYNGNAKRLGYIDYVRFTADNVSGSDAFEFITKKLQTRLLLETIPDDAVRDTFINRLKRGVFGFWKSVTLKFMGPKKKGNR
jgi:hypothetical protein